jgi:hypothetical protein
LNHIPRIHPTVQEFLENSGDNTHIDLHIHFREYKPLSDHHSTFDSFSQYISTLNAHREPINTERRQMLIDNYGALVLNEFWLTNSMYVKMPVEEAKRFAHEQQDHYILLHPGHEEGGV